MFIALTMTIAKVTYSHHGQHRADERIKICNLQQD